MDGEQYVARRVGLGRCGSALGWRVAKKVNYLNQGGTVWVFPPAQATRRETDQNRAFFTRHPKGVARFPFARFLPESAQKESAVMDVSRNRT